MEGRAILKDCVKKPVCPFCGLDIDRPAETATKSVEMPVGECRCGAVYAYDATGHNLGTAFFNALVFACHLDWERALDMLSGEDYGEEIVHNYDRQSHLIIPGAFFEGRKIGGALYFIKLKGEGGKSPRSSETTGCHTDYLGKNNPSPVVREKKRISKGELETLVRDYQVESLLEAARHDRKILWGLGRLLCAGDESLRLRAAEMIGAASAVIAREDPGRVAEFLKSMINSLTDTGSSGWGTPDAIGEIISHSAENYAGYLPYLIRLLKDEARRSAALRALEKVAATRPDLLRPWSGHFVQCLADAGPEVRGLAAVITGRLGAVEAENPLEQLLEDRSAIGVYKDGRVCLQTVGQVARAALERIRAGRER
ncbi:MAG: PBS lyase [Thermoanaerobacteraceae bacterium]|nr:PBS lyase [Thermoanaerobacteraceae bacterium]